MRGLGRAYAALRRFRREQDGATLVELGIAIPLFLFLFMGLIDFGRMAFHYVVAERAMNVAARVAAVRPPACPGVPEIHQRDPSATGTLPNFGTSCRAGPDICLDAGTVTCDGSAANATADEIWGLVRGAMPPGATISALSFSYSYDSNLGFLGGPYVPVVTVELQNQTFEFVSPLGRLAALAGAPAGSALGASVPFPSMSVSLPGEDLALGQSG
ncbi:pilus assembly protein [Leisingera aquaemixtae]|uniref:TadE/TadG family type IV pilus assembly protein n=1 Tax=Leisingera TaxID=191028 RepID=UPI001C95A0AD|nr:MULTISPECIES: TadE/TadG family type IV pilus assembly protein [Leisingera]MBY6067223.1 pilus assembly protein [Leisingera aquaemixtae]MCB4456548.1 pilus assembly protein [Leisingera sp. McT4-56]